MYPSLFFWFVIDLHAQINVTNRYVLNFGCRMCVLTIWLCNLLSSAAYVCKWFPSLMKSWSVHQSHFYTILISWSLLLQSLIQSTALLSVTRLFISLFWWFMKAKLYSVANAIKYATILHALKSADIAFYIFPIVASTSQKHIQHK